jgi:hypothetical protein
MDSAKVIAVRLGGLESHCSEPPCEDRSIGTVIVAHQIGRRRLPWERLHHLLRQPFCRWMPRHRKPEQLASAVAHNQERKQALEGHGRNHAEIDRCDGFAVIAQERPPSLRWWPSLPHHVLGNGRLGDRRGWRTVYREVIRRSCA